MTRHFGRAVSLVCSASAVLFGTVAAVAQSAPAADSIVSKMTPEQKIDYIGGTGFAIRAVPELGLPALEMSDGPVGVRSNLGFPSTTYTAGIALAASWDPELAERVGAGIGKDARARGVHFMLGPGINIYRSPRNGRNFEYFGEDPFLTSAMAVGYITGMQKQDVSATVKHFMGNNSEYLRHDSDTIIDERTMREIYLPGFEAAVKKAHVGAIMDSYNLTNGEHMTQNGKLNIDLVRKDWGFDGIMMSDWVATYDGVAAANGGLDIEMPNGAFMNRKNLLPALQSGRVSQATIDEKIKHIIDTANRFGWLNPGYSQTDSSLSTYSLADQAVALDEAREGIVLLKNDGKLLPLDKSKIKTILVIGPDAYPGTPVGGGSAGVAPFHNVSALEGIGAEVAPGTTVLYERGLPTLKALAGMTNFVTEAQNGKPGLTVEYYDSKELSGTPVKTANVHNINDAGKTWQSMMDDLAAVLNMMSSTTKPKGNSRRWTGYYVVTNPGAYVIALQNPGEGNGDRLSVDGKIVIDNWKISRAYQPHVTLPLSAGPHKIVAEDWQDSPIGGELRVAIVDPKTFISAKVKEEAAKADAVVIAAGFDAESEGEGADRTFDLPFGQDQLIQEISAQNKNTIVAVTSGGNVDSESWIGGVPAYLQLWYPGEAGGTALAEVLFGDVNPSGHLPATFEKKAEDNPTYNNYYPEGDSIHVTYKEGIFVGYRGYERNNVTPRFPFGYGLSYTTFKFANLTVAPDGSSAGTFNVAFDVTNTGDRAGATVAQVYVADPQGAVPEPPKQLKGFSRVTLKPGETQHVTVTLGPRAFAYYSVAAKKWTIPPGDYGVVVGDSSADIALKGSVPVSELTDAALQ
jgi:beta-glucosidase